MVTVHALERVSERMGFSSSTAGRVIENALYRGASPDELPARERRYLKTQEDKQGCIAKLYNGFCFIFNEEGTCITMYLPPRWFGKKPKFVGKEPIRNERRYARHYDISRYESDIAAEEYEYGI